jgi:hypothetical protein
MLNKNMQLETNEADQRAQALSSLDGSAAAGSGALVRQYGRCGDVLILPVTVTFDTPHQYQNDTNCYGMHSSILPIINRTSNSCVA